MDEFEIDREALRQAFLAEAGEALAGMEQRLVVLERRPDDEALVHELFRAAHTIKGSSGIVGFDGMGDVAHHVEDLLSRLRARTLRVTGGLVTLLLQSVDVMRTSMLEAADGRPSLSAEAEAFRDRLRGAAAGDASAAQAGAWKEGPGAAAAGAELGDAGVGSPRTLRVDISRLDRLIELSGELSISRGRIADMLERLGGPGAQEILEAHRQADQISLDLQDLIMRSRMVPLGPVFQALHRVVRDVATAQGKQVRLALEGGEVEMDTAVVERIRDPLTHMVRNAVDHGVETPAQRRARGKDPCGCVTLRASREAGGVLVQVTDDGAGVDPASLLRRAVDLGLVKPGAEPSEEAVRRLVFEPGFSTSDRVTAISGRGVGMDVVRRNAESMRGSVDFESTPGRGTTVTMRLPLTLAIIQGFRVRVGEELYVLPMDSVLECFELASPTDPARPTGVFDLRGVALPLLDLRALFEVPERVARRRAYAVVVQAGHTELGLVVDEILGETQTVIKALGRLLGDLGGVSGSAILGDGRVALVLDIPQLLAQTLRSDRQRARPEVP